MGWGPRLDAAGSAFWPKFVLEGIRLRVVVTRANGMSHPVAGFWYHLYVSRARSWIGEKALRLALSNGRVTTFWY